VDERLNREIQWKAAGVAHGNRTRKVSRVAIVMNPGQCIRRSLIDAINSPFVDG
jgi:hypothetical protein